MTLIEVLKRATGYLDQHGCASPRLDAELLLAHALDLRRIDLYLQFERQLGEPELTRYRDLIARRGRGEPVAYMTGVKEFMGLAFEVTPAVLLPNPDTEVLVQRAVELARARGGPVAVADIGTGSGCIAVAVAHYVAEAALIATDIDPAALEVAARNVARHSLQDRIWLVEGDLLQPLAGPCDILCANLPYVAEGADLPAEVTAQPAGALYGGPTGAELVLRLLAEGHGHLAEGGVLLAEADVTIMDGLAEAARRQYGEVKVLRDLGGKERVLEAWKT